VESGLLTDFRIGTTYRNRSPPSTSGNRGAGETDQW
jgi:hypothetical protein